jgi:hypothetical protein
MRPNDELLARATAAYERGRWWKGLRTAALVVPMMLVSFGCCGTPSTSCVLAGLLAVLATVLVWRGGSGGRAVVPGFAAGIVPLALPLVACPACASLGVAGLLPLLSCAVAGLASGAIVVVYAARERQDHRAAFVVAAGAVSALAGSLGCVIVGLGGVVAMAAGLVLVTPFAMRARTA